MAVPYKLNYFEIETGIDSTSTFIHTGDLTATKVKKYLATSNDILLGDGTTTPLSGLQPTGNYITALTGEATATGPGSVAITLTNSAVIGKVLTGLSITGSAIASTDTILQAFGKVQNQINGKQNTLTLTTTGSSGSSTFIADVLNVPTYTLSGLGGVPTSRQLTINGTAYDLSADRSWSVGTVTSVAALTLGTTGTDLSSTVANSTTTPVITLNVPTASATNRGALSAADWTTFNSKQDAITLTTTGSSGASTFISNTLNVPTYTLSGLGGVPTTRQLTINGTAYDLSADRSWSVGTVTSVGITMPAAFSIANSPVTGAGTIAITGAGLASQYIRGDGALGDFPNTGGGGSSVSYYLNGSINQGTFVGNTYYEMNKTPVIGAGTDFTINADGYIAQFITDANDPASLLIPGGNWNVEMYFSASSSGGTPSFYVELYKYDGTAFTLLGSSSATPEGITNGTAIDIYYTSVGIPETVLTITDRLAIRVYVTHSGRTITLHTEDNHLSEIVTTFSNGLTALNGLTKQVQFLAVGTSGTDFNISSSVDTHTFNLPTASATARGLITTGSQTLAGTKTFNDNISVSTSTANSAIQATSTKADGRALSVLATSTLEPFAVVQNGTGKLAAFSNTSGEKFIIYNSGSFEANGATLYANLDGTTATFTGLLTGATATFTNSGAGIGLGVTNSGSGDGIKITHSLGRAFRIESSSTGYGILINNLTASTSVPFTIQKQGSTVITMSDTGAANFTGQLTLGSTITNGTYTYTLPSATGTLALTSALSGYLPLTGGTLSTTNTTETLRVSNGGTGYGLYVQSDSYFQGDVKFQAVANSLLKTVSNVLTAAVAGTDYVIPSALSSYLPLSGGTLTNRLFIDGNLSGNNILFAKNVHASGYGLLIQGGNSNYALEVMNYLGATILSANTTALTLSVPLSGTSATFSSSVSASGGASGVGLKVVNTTNARVLEMGYSTGSGSHFLQVYDGASFQPLVINNTLTLASTGAATFSGALSGTSVLATTWVGAQGIRYSSAPPTQGVYLGNSGTSTNDFATIEMVGGVTGGSEIDFTAPNLDRKGRIGYDNFSNYMWFETNAGTERMRITSGGFTKSSNTGTYFGSTGDYHETRTNQQDWVSVISNTNASNPYGLFLNFTGATPNNTGNEFLYCRDGGITVRATIRSNGGIANYSANDVNLSDERTKKDIEPLESYWDKFKAIEIVKFKYKDQTHDDFNIGVIAQQVEAVAPEFVDVDGWDNKPKLDEEDNEIINDEEPLKSIYTADLYHATIKVVQECMSKIEELKAEIDLLKGEPIIPTDNNLE